MPPEQVAPAANTLGNMYEQGAGIPMDGKQAASWYTKSAELGYAKAQANLGRVYYEGLLVKKDLVQCYMWLKLSSLQGDTMALHLLGQYLMAKNSAMRRLPRPTA